MSVSSLPSSFKVCATCVFWGGSRSTDTLRYYSRFDSNLKGECLGGAFNRAMMSPNASCSKWTKWTVLK